MISGGLITATRSLVPDCVVRRRFVVAHDVLRHFTRYSDVYLYIYVFNSYIHVADVARLTLSAAYDVNIFIFVRYADV